MAMKRDGITYPDEISKIVRDRPLLFILEQHLRGDEAGRNMLLFLQKPPKPDTAAALYLGPSAKNPVPVPNALKKTIDALSAGTEDEDEAGGWDRVLRSATAHVEKEFNSKTLPAFFAGHVFQRFHAAKATAQAAKAMKLAPKKVAEALDVRGVAEVKDILVAVELGQDSEARDALKKLIRKNKLRFDPKKVLVKLKAGKMPSDDDKIVEAKVNSGVLKKVGFLKSGNSKLRDLTLEMIAGAQDGDRVLVRNAFKKIKAIEIPEGLSGTDQRMSNDLLVKLKSAKAF